MSKKANPVRVASVLTFYLESKKVRDTDPMKAIAACRMAYKSNRTGHTQRQRALMVEAFEFALEAADDPELMQWFLNQEYFKKFKRNLKPSRILAYSLFYLMDVEPESTDYDTACTYEVAMRPLFTGELDPKEVAAMLDEKGIDGLHDEGVAWKRGKTIAHDRVVGAAEAKGEKGGKVRVDEGEEIENGDDGHIGSGGDIEGEELPFGSKDGTKKTLPLHLLSENGDEKVSEPLKTTKAGKGSHSNGAVPKVPKSIEGPVLIVEIAQNRLDRVLSLPVDEKLVIVVKRDPDVGNWRRITATGVRSFEVNDDD